MIHYFIYLFNPMPPHVPYGLRGLPSRLWPKCNRLLRLRRPWGAVTLSRWGALNLNCTNYPDHGHHGDPPLSRKNPHGRAGNGTWDLMISSQKCWPLDHEIYLYFTTGTYWGVKVYLHEFLTSLEELGGRPTSCPGCFSSKKDSLVLEHQS
jgi:hypothetical protein